MGVGEQRCRTRGMLGRRGSKTGVIRPKGRVDDDGIYVVRDGEEHKLENMSPRKSDSEGAWSEMPSHPERNEGESSQE